MAKAPRDPNAPRRKRSASKPRRVFLMYKGDISDHKCVASSDEALDLQDADKSWRFMRLTVPVRQKAVETSQPA